MVASPPPSPFRRGRKPHKPAAGTGDSAGAGPGPGAGGGGCAVTLLGIENVSTSGKDESNMKTKIKELMETLKIKEQFDCFECDIGGPGVRLNRVVVEEK